MDETRRWARGESPFGSERRSLVEGDDNTLNSYQQRGHSDDMSSLGFRGSEDQSIASMASSSLQQSHESSLWAVKRRSDIPLTIHEGDEKNNSQHTNRQTASTSSSLQHEHESTHSSRSEMTTGAANLSHGSLLFNPRSLQSFERLEPLTEVTAEMDATTTSFSRTGSPEKTTEISDHQQTTRTNNMRSSIGLGTIFTAMSADTENEKQIASRDVSGQYETERPPKFNTRDGAEGDKAKSTPPRPNQDDADSKLFDGSFVMQDSVGEIQVDDATLGTMESNQRFFDDKSIESPTHDFGEPLLREEQGNTSNQGASSKDDRTAYTMGSNVQYFGRTTPSTIGGDLSVGGAAHVKTPSPLGSKTRSEEIGQSYARGRLDSKDDATAYTMGSNVQYFGRTTPSTLGGDRSAGGAAGVKTPSPSSNFLLGSQPRNEETNQSFARGRVDSKDNVTAYSMGSNMQYFGRVTPSGTASVAGSGKTPSPTSAQGARPRQSPSPSLAHTHTSGPSRDSRPSPDMSSLAGTDFLSVLRETRAATIGNEVDQQSVTERSKFAAQTNSSDIQSFAGTGPKHPSTLTDAEESESYAPSEYGSQVKDHSLYASEDGYAAKRGDQSTVRDTRSLDGSSSHLDQTSYSQSASAYGSLYRDPKKLHYKSDASIASTKSSGSRDTTPYMLRPSNVRPRAVDGSEVEVSMDGFLHPSKPVYSDDDMTKTYVDAKSYRSQSRSYYYGGEDRGDDFTYVDESAPHAIPGIRSRMVLIAALACLLGTSIFFASRVGPFYVSPETVVTQEQASSLLRQSRILDQAGIQSTSTSSGSSSSSSGTGSSGSTGVPAVSGLTTMGSSAIVASGGRSNLAIGESQQRDVFTTWGSPYGGLSKELPTLWSFELSGGDVVQRVFGQCLGKVQAANGADFDTGNVFGKYWVADHLKIVTVQGQHFVNVDMFSMEGIERASRLQLAQAHAAEVMISPYLHDMTKVFLKEDPRSGAVTGRLMVVFRDPIKRALNRYEEIRRAQGSDFSLMKYAQSNVYNENNPLTRAILGLSKSDPLNDQALKEAIRFMDNKVFVGLFEDMEHTLKRFEQFLGWHSPSDTPCHSHVKQEWSAIYSFDAAAKYDVTDPFAFNVVVAQHRMDMKVYRHAKALWEKQLKQLTQG